MQDHGSTDHLNSSLTDLMTSLMVIFILLLLVFVSNTAAEIDVARELLLGDLDNTINPEQLPGLKVERDETDRNVILLVVPKKLMNFETGKSILSSGAQSFLQDYSPKLASVLCGDDHSDSVSAIVVEGYADKSSYRNATQEESESLNLKLSQDRAMEVVKKVLSNLSGKKADRDCFLQKLSASGRGQQDTRDTDEESRRVVLKIRLRQASKDDEKKLN
jgi:outer membrane protein OmpA-like peptidoglycan-associated protein